MQKIVLVYLITIIILLIQIKSYMLESCWQIREVKVKHNSQSYVQKKHVQNTFGYYKLVFYTFDQSIDKSAPNYITKFCIRKEKTVLHGYSSWHEFNPTCDGWKVY